MKGNKLIKMSAALVLGVGLSIGAQCTALSNAAEAADYWCYSGAYGAQCYVMTESIRGDAFPSFTVNVKWVENDSVRINRYSFQYKNNKWQYFVMHTDMDWEPIYTSPSAHAIWDVCEKYFDKEI